jgi:hypothetical protein
VDACEGRRKEPCLLERKKRTEREACVWFDDGQRVSRRTSDINESVMRPFQGVAVVSNGEKIKETDEKVSFLLCPERSDWIA